MFNPIFKLGCRPLDLPAFNRENVGKAPDKPGIYILYQPSGPFYVGRSGVSIRDRLRAHLGGYGNRNVKLAMRIREAASCMTFTYAEIPKCTEREVEALLIPILGTTKLANMRHEGLYESSWSSQ